MGGWVGGGDVSMRDQQNHEGTTMGRLASVAFEDEGYYYAQLVHSHLFAPPTVPRPTLATDQSCPSIFLALCVCKRGGVAVRRGVREW